MEFRILGPLEVWDGRTLLPIPHAPRQRTLLVALLLRANQAVSVEWLTRQVWGSDPPASARVTLQNHVRRLRQIVHPVNRYPLFRELLVTRPPGYVFELRPDQLDLHVFHRLTAEARQWMDDNPDYAAQLLRKALGLWRGRPLADVDSESLVRNEVPRLEELRLAALEERNEAELRLGRHAELVSELTALVAEHPLRERFHAQLMVALYRCDRQADALEVYRRLRRGLVAELAIEPSSDLQRLEKAILTADPALQPEHLSPHLPGARTAATAHGAAAPPHGLPPDVSTFTGRHQELERLFALLGGEETGPCAVCAIDGMAGVGKSALAIHAAHRLVRRFPDGQLYVDLRGATAGLAPVQPIEVLRRFLHELGVADEDVLSDLEEAACQYRSLMFGRSALVLLDNAVDGEQVRPLLPGGPCCAALVTSRSVLADLDGAPHLHLGVLSAEESVALLGRIIGPARVDAEPEATAGLARLCGYLPLALWIAGTRLTLRPEWPVSALAERLADERSRLDELQVGDAEFRVSLDLSYRALRDRSGSQAGGAARMFRLLGRLDGPHVTVPMAAALDNVPEAVAQARLERLVDAQLLDTHGPGRYHLHDLVRLYARERAARDDP
jgi:DNA-binding SARP family transcriptional activator